MIPSRAAKLVPVLAGWLALSAACASASRIIIDDSLRADADVLRVKMGVQMPLRTWQFKFGEYAIIQSKMSPAKTTTTGGGSLEQSLTVLDFWFLLKGAGSETARVEAFLRSGATNIDDIAITSDVAVGAEGITGVHDNLVATLSIEGEEAPPWKLFLNAVRTGGGTGERTIASYMTDGTREITLTPVTNDAPGAKRHAIPARGYEFAENGNVLGALQYYGGGVFGLNMNYIHLRRDLDPRTKLLLAAAMTAVLQVKTGSPGD
jgi:hypothetical protein